MVEGMSRRPSGTLSVEPSPRNHPIIAANGSSPALAAATSRRGGGSQQYLPQASAAGGGADVVGGAAAGMVPQGLEGGGNQMWVLQDRGPLDDIDQEQRRKIRQRLSDRLAEIRGAQVRILLGSLIST